MFSELTAVVYVNVGVVSTGVLELPVRIAEYAVLRGCVRWCGIVTCEYC